MMNKLALAVLLTAVSSCSVASSASAETWIWDGSLANTQELTYARPSGDATVWVVGPVTLPAAWDSHTVIGAAKVLVRAGRSGETGLVQVHALSPSVTNPASISDASSLEWNARLRGSRHVTNEALAVVNVKDILNAWLDDPELPRFLVVGTLEGGDRRAAPSGQAIDGSTLLQLKVHYTTER